jgi:hypothetical protein
MLVSIKYNRYDYKTNEYIYTIVDSDFGSVGVGVEVGVGGGVEVGVGAGVAVVREYSRRKLSVGRNLALAVLYLAKMYYSIKQHVKSQDIYCPKYIENWDQYAKERDYHLEKLLVLK